MHVLANVFQLATDWLFTAINNASSCQGITVHLRIQNLK